MGISICIFIWLSSSIQSVDQLSHLIQGCLLLLTGDQGFLNSYYSEFANAHVFDPNLSPDVRKSRPAPEMERLSTLYNADVGLYMLANKVIVCAFISCCTCYVIKIGVIRHNKVINPSIINVKSYSCSPIQ